MATKKVQASLALQSFDVDEVRARTAARKKWKNGPCARLRVLSDENFLSLWPTGAFLRRLGTTNIVQLAFFFVDLDRDLPAEEIAGVKWCSDAFVSLLEELKIVVFLYTVKIVWRRSSLHPKLEKATSLGTATEHVSTFSFPLPSSGVVNFH